MLALFGPVFIPLIAVRKVARLAVGILRGLDITIEPASICIAFASFRQEEEFPDCRVIQEEHVRAAMPLVAAEFDVDVDAEDTERMLAACIAGVREVSRWLTKPHWEALKWVLDMWLVAGNWYRPLAAWWVTTDPDTARRAERIAILVAGTSMRCAQCLIVGLCGFAPVCE